MNAYLYCVRAEQNNRQTGHIYVLPSYLAVLWNNGEFDTLLFKKV